MYPLICTYEFWLDCMTSLLYSILYKRECSISTLLTFRISKSLAPHRLDSSATFKALLHIHSRHDRPVHTQQLCSKSFFYPRLTIFSVCYVILTVPSESQGQSGTLRYELGTPAQYSRAVTHLRCVTYVAKSFLRL